MTLEKSEIIWLDGKLVPWHEANVHVLTHTLHYGFGVFEGIRCYQTNKKKSVIFRLQEHVDRLFNSATILGIQIPYTKEDIFNTILDVVRKNRLDECYIRPIVFLGDNKMGLNPRGVDVRVAVAAWPWGAYLGEDGLNKGIRVRISSFNRHHVNISMTKAKACGYYINSIMAKAEAVQDGYDEAILLDTNGFVAEGSGENIFLLHKGTLSTPSLSCSNLDGITRDAVIEICKDMNIPLKERCITRDELYIADEIFLTGTAAEITPVREVDNRVIGSGKKGDVTDRIQKTFFDIVRGENPKFDKWLTEV
ncbi:MAG: branched-chain amino acid transaminase [Nitrospinae bacterium]|nr:branched-chain amino acid transaminase [Nitrospinota bacterium]MDA1108886.1 branched-chain amino acid transaminase [Nitrospinota bacterium]